MIMRRILTFFSFLFFFLDARSHADTAAVSVLTFHADNSGNFDATIAIKQAIKMAKGAGRNVYFPAGIYLVSHGFLLPDGIQVFGDGPRKSIIRLKKSLPPRTDEATQTAIFTGEKAFSLSSALPTKRITISGLTIELDKKTGEFNYLNFSMLGGIRLINAEDCLIRAVEIINPPKFGIGLFATKSGTRCRNNEVKNCVISMQPEWYLQIKPVLIPRSVETCIGLQLASYEGPEINGTAKFISRNNSYYQASKTRENLFIDNIVSGGSHGISLSNATGNRIEANKISDCSNRGIILIGAADSNQIIRNKVLNIGSAGIHLAFNCNSNLIDANDIDGILGVQGDGIKSYINCNLNVISNNIIQHFAVAGIRVSHGANGNIILDNHVIGSVPNLVGIKIVGNNRQEYKDGYHFGSPLKAELNVCKGNRVYNTSIGILVTDEMNFAGTVDENKVINNYFGNVKMGIEYQDASAKLKRQLKKWNSYN